ncbi:MAG: DUF1592 domain-containing protein [Pirellulaceae bacterium]|nr:DUF1592 domain-containing protein [Pirellulaceae bacterium]
MQTRSIVLSAFLLGIVTGAMRPENVYGADRIATDPTATDTWSMSPGEALMKKYCVRCHNDKKQEGDFDITAFDSRKSILRERPLWQEVLRVITDEEMPPENPLPTTQERAALASWVDQTINQLDWSKHKYAGHVTIPRLTRMEYANTMRDLLGMDLHVERLLPDDGQGESGFDNDRDALFITPAQMEKYLAVADQALGAVFALEREPVEIKFQSEAMFMTETRERPVQMTPDFFGYVLNRGQMTLYESVTFPVDGYYDFSLRAKSSTDGPSGARLRLNDEFKADIAVPGGDPDVYTTRVFVPAGTHQMTWNVQRPPVTTKQLATKQEIKRTDKATPNPDRPAKKIQYTQLPQDAGMIIGREALKRAPRCPPMPGASDKIKSLTKRVDQVSVAVQRPYEWLRLHGPNGDPSEIHRFRSYIIDRDKSLQEAKDVLARELKQSREEFDAIFAAANGTELASNAAVLDAVKDVAYVNTSKRKTRDQSKPGNVGIDWIVVRGPLPETDSAPLSQIFVTRPSQDISKQQAARQILEHFVPRAFRRPVDDDQLAVFEQLFAQSDAAGNSFESAIQLALTGVLVSPRFLFRVQQSRGKSSYALDDYEIASRLSYFLWLSMPDDELFSLAAAGQLNDPQVLQSQVDRMMAHQRSRAMSEAFTGAWLELSSLGLSVIPDEKLFPQFDSDLADAMKLETTLKFEKLIREGGSLLELIDSDKTFVNAALAKHYQLPAVKGNQMREVTLTDPRRGGLLGMAGVLTATSSPTRTSPVVRGKWVLETLLGRPAGDPPPDAGALPGDAGRKRGLTLREELLDHRRNPACATCHDKIDPLGFGLESFDAIGRIRTHENGKPIDSSGTLPDGTTFDGPAELKQYLLDHHKDEFTRNIARRMLSFALGRKLYYFDAPVIDTITQAVIEDNYNATTLIKQVVVSYPFANQASEVEPD